MSIAIGARLPDATFTAVTAQGNKPMTTQELCAGKLVALFAVPGAFTPTCSARHLPSFKDHLTELHAKGVDIVACTSVNDAFVLEAWAKAQDVYGKIVMLADGNGDFAKAIGLEMDAARFGMGQRSQRYSMLVKDGVVTQLNVEQGGSFEVSSGDYLLKQL